MRKSDQQRVGRSHVWGEGAMLLPHDINIYLKIPSTNCQRPPRTRHIPTRIHTVSWLLEVDIGVSERTPSNHVPAHPDRQDGPGRAEFLIQHGLSHVLMEVPDVEGGHGVTWSTGVHVCSTAGRFDQRTIRRGNFSTVRIGATASHFTVNRRVVSSGRLSPVLSSTNKISTNDV